MGIKYTRYSTETGEILGSGDCSNEEQCLIQMNDSENEHVLLNVTADDSTQWVDEEGEIVDRPALDVSDMVVDADGGSHVVELPEGSSVYYEGELIPVGNGFTFETTEPGEYVFTIMPPFPYVSKVLTITAT